jgi:hypothetical protein
LALLELIVSLGIDGGGDRAVAAELPRIRLVVIFCKAHGISIK